MADTQDSNVANSASTWMQVVFSGLGVCVAIVALVIAYFAWIKPHSPDDGTKRSGTVAAPTEQPGPTVTVPTPASGGTPLQTFSPAGGGTSVSAVQDGLAVECASNQTGDTQTNVDYDLPAPFAALRAGLKADGEATEFQKFQIRVKSGGKEVANVVFTNGDTSKTIDAPLSGKDLRLEVICESTKAKLVLVRPTLGTA